MDALSEEDAWRAVQLRNDYAFGTVDDETTLLGHVRNHTEVNILHDSVEILVVWVVAREFECSLQGDLVRKSLLETLLNGVSGWVDAIVEEFESEIVPRVAYGEILIEDPEESF